MNELQEMSTDETPFLIGGNTFRYLILIPGTEIYDCEIAKYIFVCYYP